MSTIPKSRAVKKTPRVVSVAQFEGPAAVSRPVVPLKDRGLRFGDKWEYAPAPETSDYLKISPRHELFINGKFVAPHSAQHFDSVNPASEEKLREIAASGEQDEHTAAQCARLA